MTFGTEELRTKAFKLMNKAVRSQDAYNKHEPMGSLIQHPRWASSPRTSRVAAKHLTLYAGGSRVTGCCNWERVGS
jgi:hypothetical protein